MGIFSIIIYTIWIRNIYLYGLENLSKEYVLSFLPSKKYMDSLPVKYYEEKLKNTGNFKTVKIEKIGRDTVDLWVILEEKERFSFLLPVDLTPVDKYTVGIGIRDRFFLKKEQILKILVYFLNMKKMEILWMNYRRKIFPFLWFKYTEYRHPFGFLLEEIPLSVGIRIAYNFDYFLYFGLNRITVNKGELENPLRFNVGFTFLSHNFYFFENFIIDHYNAKKTFISDSLEFYFSFNFKNLVFNPGLKGVIQSGYIPLYRKIFWGGYRNLRSYPFGTFIGNSALMGKIDIFYPILSFSDSLNIGVLVFAESGNVYDNYKDLRNKKILKGFGAGIRFTLPINKNLDIYITYNQERRWGFGISIEGKKKFFKN